MIEPILTSKSINDLMSMSDKNKTFEETLIFSKNGTAILSENLNAHISTGTKKLIDFLLIQREKKNEIIPLMEFWDAQGCDVCRKVETKREKSRLTNIRQCLKTRLNESLETVKSLQLGERRERVITGFEFLKNYRLKVEFGDMETDCRFYFPTCLFNVHGASQNTYPIGREIALCNSNHISVSHILDVAPKITCSNTRDWKRCVRDAIERSLNALEKIGFLKSWHYVTEESDYESYKKSKICYELVNEN